MIIFFRNGFMRVIFFSCMTVVLLTECRAEDNEKHQETVAMMNKEDTADTTKNNLTSKRMKRIGNYSKNINIDLKNKDNYIKSENVTIRESGIMLNDASINGIMITKKNIIAIDNPISDIMITIIWYGSENIEFKYQLSTDGNIWTEWKDLPKSKSDEPKKDKNRFVTDYNPFSKTIKYIRYMIIIKSGVLEKFEIKFFTAGIMVEDK